MRHRAGRFVGVLAAGAVSITMAARPVGAAELIAGVVCGSDNLQVEIFSGDGPVNVFGSGPGLPLLGVPADSFLQFYGPATFSNVFVAETTGDAQTTTPVSLTCNGLLFASWCNGNNLNIHITKGTPNFNITGSGAQMPRNGVGVGVHSFVDAVAPFSWSGILITEVGGDQEQFGAGGFTCPDESTVLTAGALCNLEDLEVRITQGNGPFNITGSGPGLPINGVAKGVHHAAGHGVWRNVKAVETTGDLEEVTLKTGPFACRSVSLAFFENGNFGEWSSKVP